MKRVPIQSDKLLSIGYDAELHVLEVELSNHDVYQFVQISAAMYAALINAPNIYEYFKANIDTKFLCRKV